MLRKFFCLLLAGMLLGAAAPAEGINQSFLDQVRAIQTGTSIAGTLMRGDSGYSEDSSSSTVPGNMQLRREDVISIEFLSDRSGAPADAWDMSAVGNGSVLAWTEPVDGMYALHIAGDGIIRANADSSRMFDGYKNAQSIEFNGVLDTSEVTNMWSMFYDCSSLTELDVSGFDTSQVIKMRGMFAGCSGLTELDVTNFDTSNVEDMGVLFAECSGLTELDVTNFDTSSVKDMSLMFLACSGLTELDVSNFDTSQVTNMWFMFEYCSGLTGLDVSNFNTSQVKNMNGMFRECSSLTELDLSRFNTSQVNDMSRMFEGCSTLQTLDISSFTVSDSTKVENMIKDCRSLKSQLPAFVPTPTPTPTPTPKPTPKPKPTAAPTPRPAPGPIAEYQVSSDGSYTMRRGESIALRCYTVYDSSYEIFRWVIVEGDSLVSLAGDITKSCMVTANRAGTARVRVTYEYSIEEPDVLTGIPRRKQKTRTYDCVITITD